MSIESQYIRFKKEKKTFFIECMPSDPIQGLKMKLKDFLGVEPEDMRFVKDGVV